VEQDPVDGSDERLEEVEAKQGERREQLEASLCQDIVYKCVQQDGIRAAFYVYIYYYSKDILKLTSRCLTIESKFVVCVIFLHLSRIALLAAKRPGVESCYFSKCSCQAVTPCPYLSLLQIKGIVVVAHYWKM